MGVGSPPPVQGDMLKYRWKIQNIQDGNSLRIHSVSFSLILVPRTHLKLWGNLRTTRISSQHSFPQIPRFAQWAITTAKANQMYVKANLIAAPHPLPGSSLLPKPFPLQSEYPSQKDHRLRCSSMLICLASCKGKSWHILKMIGDST